MSRTFPLEKVRNIAIIAHIDAGKTTLTERILYYTGATYKIGGVDEGTTVTDWMAEERKRGITITSAAITCHWRDYRINIIDTPGHVDFTAEVERCLRVLDGGVVLFDAVQGVEAQSETVWRQADRYNVPRVCFVNKMERVGASFERTVGMIESRLHAKPLSIQIPIGAEDTFQGVIDLIEKKAYSLDGDREQAITEISIPETYLAKVNEARHNMIEKLAEADDHVLTSYLDGIELSNEDIRSAIRRTTIAAKLVPVLCGSALTNRGVRLLLDAVGRYLPSPSDMPPTRAVDYKNNNEVIRQVSDEEPFTALAFKVVTDPFVGRLVYFRVYSGEIKSGDQVFNTARGKPERIGRLFLMHANRRDEIETADTGSIVATLGLKNTFTGDTLSSMAQPVLLESIKFPEPVISIAIEPKSRADQDKMGEALRKLSEEDPTFKVTYNEETGQIVIAGMGELHLEIISHRLFSEFGVSANVGTPRVAYKETVTLSVEAEGRFVRQSGGRGQYGDVWLSVEPTGRGGGFEFVDRIKGGTIPRNYVPAIEAGVKEALEAGVVAGYPIVDIRVTVFDGSYHEVDSSEMAFKMAGSMALKNGVQKAKPVILEPIMKMEVITPKEFLGDIIGDVSSRRGHIESIDTHGDICIIQSLIPLSETFGYATSLRSQTQGRANHTLEFNSYQEIPASLAKEVAERTGMAKYA
ncbi:MAG: elongation factor G [Dehalococcoidales bacterium]|nr:elongation factor G [Dehalococcoidales bacterium]